MAEVTLENLSKSFGRTRAVRDRWVPVVALAAPALCWLIDANQARLFGAWQLGLELLLLNGALAFAGLWAFSQPAGR